MNSVNPQDIEFDVIKKPKPARCTCCNRTDQVITVTIPETRRWSMGGLGTHYIDYDMCNDCYTRFRKAINGQY